MSHLDRAPRRLPAPAGDRRRRLEKHLFGAPSTLLEMLGVTAEWESGFTMPSGGWEMLPILEVRRRIEGRERTTICVAVDADGEPTLGRHTLAAFGLAADHGEWKPVQADMYLT